MEQLVEELRDLTFECDVTMPEDCPGLKHPFAFVEFEYNGIRGNLDGRVDKLVKALTYMRDGYIDLGGCN